MTSSIKAFPVFQLIKRPIYNVVVGTMKSVSRGAMKWVVLWFIASYFLFLSFVIYSSVGRIQNPLLHSQKDFLEIRRARLADDFMRSNVSSTQLEKIDNIRQSHNTVFPANQIAAEAKKDMFDERRVVLHVGPHKTASTTLQAFLFQEQNTSIPTDGYATPGEIFSCRQALPFYKNTAHLATSLQKRCFHDKDQVEIMGQFLNESFHQGRHTVILSSEEFDRASVDIPKLQKQFAKSLGPNYHENVQIVIYYRRYYEWIRSWYFEEHKSKFAGRFPSFIEWVTTPKAMKRFLQMYTFPVKDRFESHGFHNILVIPMLDLQKKSDITLRFFCNHLKGASHMCEAIQKLNKSKEGKPKNAATSIENHRIFNHARDNGLTNATKQESGRMRKKIRDKWNALSEEERIPFLTCLSEVDQKKLWDLSVGFEENVGPMDNGMTPSERVALMKKDFDSKIQTEKYCSVNATKLFELAEWRAIVTKS